MTRTRRFFNCIATCSPLLTISIMTYLAYYTQVNDNWSKIVPKMFGLSWLLITMMITILMTIVAESAALWEHLTDGPGVWRHARQGAYGRTVIHAVAVGMALWSMLSTQMQPGFLVLACSCMMITSLYYYFLDLLDPVGDHDVFRHNNGYYRN